MPLLHVHAVRSRRRRKLGLKFVGTAFERGIVVIQEPGTNVEMSVMCCMFFVNQCEEIKRYTYDMSDRINYVTRSCSLYIAPAAVFVPAT